MFPYRIRLLVDAEEKKAFKENYELISGLPITDHYLYTNDVFGLVYNNTIIGGFIAGSNHPLRTYLVFAHEANWARIDSRLSHHNLCEICCLWLARKYWNWFTTSVLWFNAARIISRHKGKLVVFGTISKGNKILYDSLLHAELIHRDQVSIHGQKKYSWVYAMPAKYFFADISRGLAQRFCNHIAKWAGMHRSKYLVKGSYIKPSLK